MSRGSEPQAGEVRVHRRGEVSSTNDVAFELAEAGCGEGTVVVAESQRKGRGRHGRTWFSPPGLNLYFSVLLAPLRPQREWPELPWVVAGALACVLRECGLGDLALKSPNDLLARGKKIAGVLLENRIGADAPKVVVAGAGLNVNLQADDLPGELREMTTSMRIERGRSFDREELLPRLLESIGKFHRLWNENGADHVRGLFSATGLAFVGFPGPGVE